MRHGPQRHSLRSQTSPLSREILVTFLIRIERLLSLAVTCQRPSKRLSMEPVHGWVMAKTAVAWIGGRDGPTLSRVFHRRRARTGFPEFDRDARRYAGRLDR